MNNSKMTYQQYKKAHSQAPEWVQNWAKDNIKSNCMHSVVKAENKGTQTVYVCDDCGEVIAH